MMSTASNSSLKHLAWLLTTSVTSALEVDFNVMRSINSRFTYLLTYLLVAVEFRRERSWKDGSVKDYHEIHRVSDERRRPARGRAVSDDF